VALAQQNFLAAISVRYERQFYRDVRLLKLAAER